MTHFWFYCIVKSGMFQISLLTYNFFYFLCNVDVFRNSGPVAIQTKPYEKHCERHDGDCTDIKHAKFSK